MCVYVCIRNTVKEERVRCLAYTLYACLYMCVCMLAYTCVCMCVYATLLYTRGDSWRLGLARTTQVDWQNGPGRSAGPA